MNPIVQEWLNLVVRWIHVLAGIMWIGDSFLFMWLDSHLSEPTKAREGAVVGELWMTHSGGFYEVVKRKYLRPEEMPKQLYWFKWESYTTWITGTLLLAIVYYLNDAAYLIDANVMQLTRLQAVGLSVGLLAGGWLLYDLLCSSPLSKKPELLGFVCFVALIAVAYGLTKTFSGRAAFIHTGALMGTIMSANVFFRIIPSQKNMLAATAAGIEVDTSLGVRAKTRSRQNHYMTLPVLFTMLSSHFPSTYGSDHPWLVLALLFIFGAGLKYFMNFRWATNRFILAATVGALAGVFFLTFPTTANDPILAALANHPPVTFNEANAVVQTRCITCHSLKPANPSFVAAPSGVMFDTPEQVRSHSQRMLMRAVATKTMPLANLTGMTDAERTTLGAWIIQGASIEGATPTAPPTPATAPAAPPTGDPAAQAKEIFTTRCVTCHGSTGNGDGPASAAMNPKPRSYNDHPWQLSVTDAYLQDVIVKGGGAMGKSFLMPPNGDLEGRPEVVAELVKIVRGFDAPQRPQQ